MWIHGFIHDESCPWIGKSKLEWVQLVSKWTADHRAGTFVGYMFFTDGAVADVYKHPGGTYYGYIWEEEE